MFLCQLAVVSSTVMILYFLFIFSHGSALGIEPVSVVNQPIKNGSSNQTPPHLPDRSFDVLQTVSHISAGSIVLHGQFCQSHAPIMRTCDALCLPLELAFWMFDRIAYSAIGHRDFPEFDLASLLALQLLLAKIADSTISGVDGSLQVTTIGLDSLTVRLLRSNHREVG
jgi:hypothetical protein